MPGSTADPFGSLLRRFRQRRHLTQRQLATAIGVHRTTIGRWEDGSVLPESKALVLDLARQLHLDDQETRQLLEASLTALAPHWHVPLPRNPFFTGRKEILAALAAQPGGDHAGAITHSAALHGPGGVGKTQIALEYAYRHALDYRAVFWIRAETRESILASLHDIAQVLQLPEQDDLDQQRAVTAVQHWLTTHREWLMIWDNLEELEWLAHYLPPARRGALLITTRSPVLGTLARGIEVATMQHEEALLFVLRRTKVLEPEAMPEHVQQFAMSRPSEYAATSALITAMGALPLALDQAGAYIEETGCGIADYLQRYEQQQASLLARRGGPGSDHPQSVTATFRLALEQVERQQQAAADLLRVCAMVQADAIPEELFVAGAAHLGPALEALGADPSQLDQALAALRRFSLVKRHPETQTLSLHRLVQAVLLGGMTEGERQQWITRTISALEAVFPELLPASTYATWQQCERFLSHALPCLHSGGAPEESLTVAALAYKAAQYLRERGRYTEAEPLYQRALHVREQQLGPDHLEVASSLVGLAGLYYVQGRVAEAEPLYQRALHVREQQLGPDHLDVASLLANLANLSFLQARFAEAEPLYQRALHVREQTLGATHPLVANSLAGLAELYLHQLQFGEAEPLYQRALRIGEQALGPDHPQVVYALNGLGILWREQGRYAEAEPLLQRALRIREHALGATHPQVAQVLNNLAILFQRQGKNAEAEPLFRRALHIREQQLGQHHPETVQTLLDLANFQQKQGNLGQARAVAERALQICVQSLGEAHPKTIAARALCARLLRQQAGGQEAVTAEGSPEARNGAQASVPPRGEAGPLTPENDPLQAFLRACCELHPRAWCRSADLWQAYEQWARGHQEPFPLSRGAFIAQLKAHGCHADRTMTARIWRGITLVKPEA